MRLFYLSLLTLLHWTFFIEANEHFLFDSLKPTSTIILTQDEQQPTHVSSSNDKDKNDDNKRVKTEIDVIYTTIIVAATTSLPVYYNVSDKNPAQQQQSILPTQSAAMNDPNKQNSVKDDLEKDKQALKRMSTILSLVGGLGVIAIVATIVIFTRMRSRHRKQREIDEEGNEGSTYELSADVDQANTIDSSTPGGGNASSISSHSSSSSDHLDTPLIEPSAPPALSMVDDRHSLINKQAQQHNRRTVMSMSSQTAAPSPSAPTAKELDAMVDEQASSSSPQEHNHDHATTSASATNCSRCTIAPELPPPAYTPSAPPHYALPAEPIIMEQSRRHSLGG